VSIVVPKAIGDTMRKALPGDEGEFRIFVLRLSGHPLKWIFD